MTFGDGVQVTAAVPVDAESILTPEALQFVADLHRRFNPTRHALLARRTKRQEELAAGGKLDFLTETQGIRDGEWQVGLAPADLNDRRVEITGPTERKMMINALNSGAKVFMADFEDALSPTLGERHRRANQSAVTLSAARSLSKSRWPHLYLNDETATLLIRPRGWHLAENAPPGGRRSRSRPASLTLASTSFATPTELLARGSGPYFYLPKMESHLEARLWNDVFNLCPRAARRPAWFDPGTVPDRDDPGRVRDGRDPV